MKFRNTPEFLFALVLLGILMVGLAAILVVVS